MSDRDPANLAPQAFWEDEYFGDVQLPLRPDPALPLERSLARALECQAPVERGARVLEVGCAPAKWMVFYGEHFGAVVEGIEYSRKGAQISRENLRQTGVGGSVHQGDFFEVEPRPFDLVLSLGFIEHFDDLAGAFAQHVRFVGPAGLLVVGVPNFKGVNRLVQRWADSDHLRMHNLAAMRPGLYRELAAEHGLEVEHIGHLGGFDPAIIKYGRPGSRLFTLVAGRYRRLRFADRIDHPLLSSYLLVVLRRA